MNIVFADRQPVRVEIGRGVHFMPDFFVPLEMNGEVSRVERDGGLVQAIGRVKERARTARVVHQFDAALHNRAVRGPCAPRRGVEMKRAGFRAAVNDAQAFVLEPVLRLVAQVFPPAGNRLHGRAVAGVDAVPGDLARRGPGLSRACRARTRCQYRRYHRPHCLVFHPNLLFVPKTCPSDDSDHAVALQGDAAGKGNDRRGCDPIPECEECSRAARAAHCR